MLVQFEYFHAQRAGDGSNGFAAGCAAGLAPPVTSRLEAGFARRWGFARVLNSLDDF